MKKRCNHKGCRALIDANESYCKRHRGSNNREYSRIRRDTDREYIDFYSNMPWRELRYQRLLRDEHMCQRCLREYGLYTNASMVHHMLNRRDYPEEELNIETLVSLCNSCHETIEATQDPKYVWHK